jgi:hypothetical protein
MSARSKTQIRTNSIDFVSGVIVYESISLDNEQG